jgi:geranylgeranyl diphosphate synthase type I
VTQTNDFASTVNAVKAVINADLESFLGDRIREASRYDQSVVEIWEAIGTFVRSIGAQVSVITAAAGAGVGRPLDAATARLGTAVELYSYGILVHDDILDRDDVRFGAPAFHALFAARLAGSGETPAETRHYGTSMALLAGALMQGLAMEAVLGLPLPPSHTAELAQLLSSGYRRLTESQVVDLSFEHRLPTPAEWYSMASQRAAEHLGTTIGLGARLAGASEHQRRAMERLACALGSAYDIRDDLRDLFGDESRMRSRTGRDLARSKKPLVLCIAAECAPAPVQRHLAELLASVRRDPAVEPNPADIAEILTLLAAHGLDAALDAFSTRIAQAREALDTASLRQPWSSFFTVLIDACAATIDEIAAGALAASGR